MSIENYENFGKLVKVANFLDRLEAETAQSLLESRGILSGIVSDDAGGLYSNLLAGATGTWVAVKPEDTGRAAEILQELDSPFDEAELEAEAMSYDPPANA